MTMGSDKAMNPKIEALLLEADNHFNRLGYTVTAYTDDGVYVRRWDSDHDYFEVRYRTGAKAV